jgi:hypothetical protein
LKKVSGGVNNETPVVMMIHTPPSETEKQQQPPTACAPHLFIEVQNRRNDFVALVDGGAQINVISESMIKNSEMTYQKTDGPYMSMKWGDGTKCMIAKWVLLPLLLPNGLKTFVRVAAIRGIRRTFILGRPFLKDIRGSVDHDAGVLTTPQGPIPLLEGYSSSGKVDQVDADKDGYSSDASTAASERDLQELSDEQRELYNQMAATDQQRLLSRSRCPHLDLDQRKRLRDLLLKRRKLWEGEIRGACNTGTHHIQLEHDYPIVTRPRRHPEDQARDIVDEVLQMLKDKVIRPSNSAYVNEVVMVKKPNGKWRVCIDFRALNKVTELDKYPLPRLADLLKSVKASTHFIALDQRWGYWQIPLEESSCRYTAFRCPAGLFEFVVMPFGLVNAPATFQRIMDKLFGDLRYEGVSTYLDDILLHGQSVDEVLDKLDEVLARMEQAGLHLNLEKCDFFPSRLKYLGHIFAEGRMFPNPLKVDSLKNLKVPTNVGEVRSLLGMLNYYHTYVNNFATIASPLSSLLTGRIKKKDPSPIKWTTECDASLTTIKQALIDAFLVVPIDSDQFLMETDASDHGVAAVVSVKRGDQWHPVEFASKKFTQTQKRWPVREKEAFAIIYGLQKFDYLLRGREFSVHTDHQSLQWIMDARAGKLSRWACLLAEYPMKVFYKKGSSLQHIDYFSRYAEDVDPVQDHMVYTICAPPAGSLTSPVTIPTIDEVKAEQRKCGHLPSGLRFSTKNGVLYYLGGIWVPEQLRSKVIASCHLVTPLHHPRVQKTESLIKKVFNWPNIHADIFMFVRSCLTCQRFGLGREHRKGLFRTHPVPGPFNTIYVDHWEASYQDSSYTLLTIIDQHTKWVEAIPIPNHNKEVLSSVFITAWVSRFGVPRTVVHDGGGSFISDMFNRLVKRLGCKPLQITPHHPEGNSPVESFHRYLRQGLTSFNSTSPSLPFQEALSLVLMSYRSTVHSSTHETPAFLTYGIDLLPPLEGDWRFATSVEEESRIRFLNALRLDIQYQVYNKRMKENMKRNEGRAEIGFALNDLVICRTHFFSNNEAYHRQYPQGKKLVPSWGTPCRVIKVDNGRKSAHVRSLISGKVRHVHLQDVRFIEPPRSAALQQDWYGQIRAEADSMFEADVRDEVLSKFWEEVYFPQADDASTKVTRRKKRKL